MLKQKPKISSLNPHAKPYIPLQMQETPDLFFYGTEEQIGAWISDRTNSKYEDKEYLKDLIYLTVLFPSTSKQLLVDVYILNNGNLGATIEMLEKGYNGSEHLAHSQKGSTRMKVPGLGCDVSGENSLSNHKNISKNLGKCGYCI